MESEESPRPKRGGCFACGTRSPEAKREKKADVLFDVSKLDFSVATLIAVLGFVFLLLFFCFGSASLRS
jgi:hypothetical protein